MNPELKDKLLKILEPCLVTEQEVNAAIDDGAYDAESLVSRLSKKRADTTDEAGVPPGSQKGRDRLAQLADNLEQLPESQFRFSTVVRRAAHSCGTIGCAMGWLPALVPGIFSRGNLINVAHELVGHVDLYLGALKVMVNRYEDDQCYVTMVDYQNLAQHVFGLTNDDAHYLFTPADTVIKDDTSDGRFDTNATPANVALRIRHYLATGEVLMK